MINIELLKKLYSNLDPQKKRELMHKLFGDGRQSLAYFERTKDTSLSKMEILADFFDMPVDALRLNSRYVYSPNTRQITWERELVNPEGVPLAKEVEQLKEKIRLLEEIESLRAENINFLREKLKSRGAGDGE